MPLKFGLVSIVCVHGEISSASCWIGEVAKIDRHNRAPNAYALYQVKQLGIEQRTTFTFCADELRETVLTFQGPMCVVCKDPY